MTEGSTCKFGHPVFILAFILERVTGSSDWLRRHLTQDVGPLAAVLQGVSSLLLSNEGREGHRTEPG